MLPKPMSTQPIFPVVNVDDIQIEGAVDDLIDAVEGRTEGVGDLQIVLNGKSAGEVSPSPDVPNVIGEASPTTSTRKRIRFTPSTDFHHNDTLMTASSVPTSPRRFQRRKSLPSRNTLGVLNLTEQLKTLPKIRPRTPIYGTMTCRDKLRTTNTRRRSVTPSRQRGASVNVSDPRRRLSQYGTLQPQQGTRRGRRWMAIGADVRIIAGRRIGLQGTIRFMGRVHFAKGEWVGVELKSTPPTTPNSNSPSPSHGGLHNGEKGGKRYFNAKHRHGLFVKASSLEVLVNEEEKPFHDAKLRRSLSRPRTVSHANRRKRKPRPSIKGLASGKR